MQPHTKKVVLMVSISLGIIMFAYCIPIFVVPVALGISGASKCTDVSCAGTAFSECGGYSAEGSSTDLWTNGVHGMLCMFGLEKGTAVNAYQFSPRLDSPISVSPSS
jgi:hypothetical protein